MRGAMGRTFVLALAFLSACSASKAGNEPPVIDKLDMPDTAVLEPTPDDPDHFAVHGTISFHDVDGVINAIRVYSEGAIKEGVLASAQASRSDAKFTVGFDHVKARGVTIGYEVSVLDDHDAESAHVKKSVQIPP